ncbi:MAG: hypothetical protein K2K41_08110 [Ruminiclostridium sp.]|nr:hypothetical protein [Ruminiclostridium sp.]
MALKLTSKDLTELIQAAQLAEPYSDDDPEMRMLDGECDYERMTATKAARILNHYFTEHPEANTFGYEVKKN